MRYIEWTNWRRIQCRRCRQRSKNELFFKRKIESKGTRREWMNYVISTGGGGTTGCSEFQRKIVITTKSYVRNCVLSAKVSISSCHQVSMMMMMRHWSMMLIKAIREICKLFFYKAKEERRISNRRCWWLNIENIIENKTEKKKRFFTSGKPAFARCRFSSRMSLQQQNIYIEYQ